jgi:Calcineurin-like phosphoesterase
MCALAALASGCGAAVAHAADTDDAFSIVVLPDTQYYARKYPDILDAQVEWIAAQRERAHIALVAHEGDIVDDDEPGEWRRAAVSLHRLDGLVPVLLSAGNHDYRRTGTHIDRQTLLDQYFGPPLRGGAVLDEGTFEPGRLENSFVLLDTDTGPWLVISLEFGPRDAALAWASALLDDHAGLPAIVVTHAYLDADGTRYDRASRNQLWNPHRYFVEQSPGEVNDGEEIWRKLISRHDNIRFVLCGHALDDGIGRLNSVRPDGTRVHEILANFQTGPLGGGGYLRIMRFSPRRRTVAVETYSPYLNQFKRDPDNQFELTYEEER